MQTLPVISADNFKFSLLKPLRLALFLDQKEMADKLGVSRVTYNGWETGRFPVPKSRRASLAKMSSTLQGTYSINNKVDKLLETALDAIAFTGLHTNDQGKHFSRAASLALLRAAIVRAESDLPPIQEIGI